MFGRVTNNIIAGNTQAFILILRGLFAVFFTLISVGCNPRPLESTLSEDVVILNPVTEIGEVWPNEKVKFEFDVINRSPLSEFLIEEVTTSCSCAILGEFIPREIDRESSLSIPGEVVFGRAPGIFSTSVAVRGRRKGSKGELRLSHKISGTIISLVNYDRNSITFGTFSKDDGILNSSLRISRGVRGDALASVEIDGLEKTDWLTAKVENSGHSGYLAEILFELNSALCPPGEFSESFRVVLKDAEGALKSEQTFPILGKRLGNHSLTPRTLIAWENGPGVPLEFELSIAAKNNASIESVGLFDSSDVELSVSKMHYSELGTVVEIVGHFPSSSRTGTIRVSVNSEGYTADYYIPFYVFTK